MADKALILGNICSELLVHQYLPFLRSLFINFIFIYHKNKCICVTVAAVLDFSTMKRLSSICNKLGAWWTLRVIPTSHSGIIFEDEQSVFVCLITIPKMSHWNRQATARKAKYRFYATWLRIFYTLTVVSTTLLKAFVPRFSHLLNDSIMLTTRTMYCFWRLKLSIAKYVNLKMPKQGILCTSTASTRQKCFSKQVMYRCIITLLQVTSNSEACVRLCLVSQWLPELLRLVASKF